MHNISFESRIQVEVITLTLFYAVERGSLFYVVPAFESALQDIERFYPRLKFEQNIVTDERYHGCGDMMDDSNDLIGRYYFNHEEKWRKANATVFIHTASGIHLNLVIICISIYSDGICFAE